MLELKIVILLSKFTKHLADFGSQATVAIIRVVVKNLNALPMNIVNV